jgi:hypothetical protein
MQLALLMPAERPALDETRPASLREADVDDIEVPGHDRLREDVTRFACDLRPEVTVRKVRQRQHLHVGGTSELGHVDGGRVQGLVRSLLLLGGEGGLVDEDVRPTGSLEDDPRRARVAGDDDLATRTRRPEHLSRQHLATSRRPDRLTGLEAAEQRPLRHPEGPGRLDVEAPGPLALHERIAVRVHTVLDVESDHPVVAPLERIARPQLDEPEVVRQLAEDAP